MTYNNHDVRARRAVSQPERNRRSIRLHGYDYSRAGAYFVTICTQNRECLFGDIVAGQMRLNGAGRIVADEWIKTAEIRDEIELDEWVVMPNHFHGIIVIADGRGDRRVAPMGCTRISGEKGDRRVAPVGCTRISGEQGDRPVAPTGPQPRSVGAVMAGFKSAATKRINELRQSPGTKLWQRNYWEHIVRNETELNRIREYIHNNPAQWGMDKLYPRRGDRRVAPMDGTRISFEQGDRPVAPTTEIREPSAMYGHGAPCPNEAAWMI
ncbi:transposase [Desulfococcus multivorans]|uniref:transposase n=1 Tax=Desulfococcus multivorans TaxID=897 RepID=UPI0008D9E005|nr:transposase [Desulfococcus multivorans]